MHIKILVLLPVNKKTQAAHIKLARVHNKSWLCPYSFLDAYYSTLSQASQPDTGKHSLLQASLFGLTKQLCPRHEDACPPLLRGLSD